jgi:hypothetical protein
MRKELSLVLVKSSIHDHSHKPEIKSKGQIKEHQSQFVRLHFCSQR